MPREDRLLRLAICLLMLCAFGTFALVAIRGSRANVERIVRYEVGR